MIMCAKYFRPLMAFLLLCGTVEATSLRIVTINLEWFPGQRGKADAAEIERHREACRRELEQLKPDVLVATEICDPDELRNIISGLPGLEIHAASSFTDAEADPERRDQQIVIASRIPAIAGWAEAWDQTIEGLRRGFAFTALENPRTGRLILVYGLHLKSNRSDTPEEAQRNYDIRDASTRQLIRHVRTMSEQFAGHGIDGWIIAGDINTNHDGVFGDQVVDMLTQEGYWNSWSRVPPEQRYSWKGREDRFPPSTLDYIFLKHLGEPDAFIHAVPASVSDHNAVVVEISLPGSAGD